MSDTPSHVGAPWISEPRFKCPICETGQYNQVSVVRPGQPPYMLPLFECMGCSAVFSDPWRFTATELNGYQTPPHAHASLDPQQVYETQRERRAAARRRREG